MELLDSAPANRDRLDDGDSELAFDDLPIELEAVALCKVDHVQGDDRGKPEIDQLKRETQMIVEIGSVEDDQ